MAYAIMRAKKLANMGSVAASMQHCYRERNTHNADQERTPDNQHLVAKSTDEAMENCGLCCQRNGAKMRF